MLLIVAGGLVTSTGSGLAVPDWPLSYGRLMPPMVGGIFYEHGHRMIASFVGFLTVILAIWLWRRESRSWVKTLGFIALGAVITQGILGGLTVLFLLPTAISVSHATLAQTFFCITIVLAVVTSRWWIEKSLTLDLDLSSSIRTLSVAVVGSLYVQLILGALMRHTGSGLAIPDFPLAYGQLFPSLSLESLQQYNHRLIAEDVRLAADGPITDSQIILHYLHRVWALVVAGLVVSAGFKLIRTGASSLKFLGFLLILLLGIQITLGAYTILTLKSVVVTTAHVANGALMLGISVLSLMIVLRLSKVKFVSFAFVRTEEQTA